MTSMIALLMLAMLQANSAAHTIPPDPFAPLAVYSGVWTVQPRGAPHPDHLQNHCTRDRAFFSCEQIVNGAPVALVVFTSADKPNEFRVANVLPNGHAAGDTALSVRGDHWTYITNGSDGHPHYRTENFFHGPDAIHFEQFTSSDGGQTWTKAGEGDEHRAQP